VNTCKTCHVFSHLSDTDESSELDSSEELQWQKAKASAIQRLENANEWDMESEISQPIRDALITPETFGEPQTIARLDEDASDSVETETVAAKKNDSNSRIRWLETKLQDVDTTLDLIAANRMREKRCCRSGFTAERNEALSALENLVREASDIGCNLVDLQAYNKLRDVLLENEVTCKGHASLYCNDCMSFYCENCHVDHNHTHDISILKTEASFRKGFLNFPGFQPRPIIGVH